MPIEIRELHVRVSVDATPAGSGGRKPGGDGEEELTDAIVSECVEQVLQILRDRAER